MPLHKYQEKMVAHMRSHPRCGLFAQMGLGKSLATLEGIKHLPKPVLIVAPLRVAQSVWEAEAKKWGYDYTFSRVLGSSVQRKSGVEADADIYLINVDNFNWLRQTYEKHWKWKTIIFDESSLFKTPGSKRTRAALWASRRATHVVLLTGTPAPKSLLDLYSQIKLLDGGERLGRSMDAYKNQYFYPTDYMRYNWKVRPGKAEVINEKLSDICLSLSAEDYLDMPELIINDIYVDLPAPALRDYLQLEKDMHLQYGHEEITAVTAAALVNKLAQFASGAVYTEDRTYKNVHDAKLQALDDIIEESAGHPVLIVYQYKHSLKRLRQRYKELVELRDDRGVITYWNKKKVPLLALHPASGGHGLNLQDGGNTIVWYDQTYNLEHYEQTNARLHRQGQEEPVIVHRLVGVETIDEDILQALDDKSSVQRILMRALK